MQIAGQDTELPEIRLRSKVFAAIVVAGLLLLAMRLFYLQVIRGDEIYRLTSESIVRTVVLAAPRGELRDRRGRVLATTRPSFDLVVMPGQLDRAGYDRLVAILAPDRPDLPEWTRVAPPARGVRAEPVTFAEDISDEHMAAVATRMDLEGVVIRPEPRRRYPYGSLFTHTLGYTNEIRGEELKRRRAEGYKPQDRVGRTGLERQMERYLRGQAGYERQVVDRRNRPLPGVNVADLVNGPVRREAVPGHNVVLTVDLGIQQAAERALRDKDAAAAVILEVDTGRILAMYSHPGFDLNLMSSRLTHEQQARLTGNPYRPFRDKTVADTYNPGSTFKVVTAAAALDAGVIDQDDRTVCRGAIELGKRKFRCTHVHGAVDADSAMIQSCNIYFYELGGKAGMMNRIAARAMDFGLGEVTGLGINGEVAGLVPTEEWHNSRRNRGEGFSLGHAFNTAIGEGATRVTVLQMALLYAAIANGGQLMAPQLIERVETAGGQVVARFPAKQRRPVNVTPETLAYLHRSLAGVMGDRRGTAWRARSHKVTMAGKTGTATTHLSKKREAGAAASGHMDHAWFAGFAPADKPQVAFAVLVEHGGFGGEVAAPVARQLVEAALVPELAQGDQGVPAKVAGNAP